MRGTTHRGDTAGDDTALDAVDRTEPVRVAHTEPFPPIIESIVSRAGRPLGWLWDHGFRFVLVLDAIALFGSMALINLVRFGTNWPTYPTSHYWIGFSLATLIHLLVGYFAGLYEREARLGYRPWLPRIVTATAISVAFDGLATLLTDRYLMPRFNLALLLVVASLALTFNRTVSRNLANRRRGPSRVLLVGNEQAVSTARRHFAESERAAVVVATASKTTGLFNIVNTEDVTDILLLDLSAFTDAFPEPLTALDREGVGVHQRVSAKETLLGLQSVRQIAGMPFTKMRTHAMASHQLRLKRYFDLVLLLATSPIWLVAIGALSLYVRVRAGSPVLYRQTRVGQGGQLFTVLKFRTMVRNAERAGPQISNKEDGRVDPRHGAGCARRGPTNCRSCGTSSRARCRSSDRVRSAPR